MKRLFLVAIAALFSSASFATTLSPIQLLNPVGSTSGKAIVSTGATTAPAWTSIVNSVIAGSGITVSGATGNVTASVSTNGVVLGQIAQQAANTVLSNATGSTANITAFSMPSCSTSVSALNWTSGTGFTCNVGLVTAATAASTYATIAQATTALAATGGSINGVTVGATTASTGAFTTLSATGLITPSTTIGIKGTGAADSAQAGSIGEYQTVTGSAIGFTSGTTAPATSLSLAAGDWDVESVVSFTSSAAGTITHAYTGVNTTSSALGSLGAYVHNGPAGTGATDLTLASPVVRISLASTTTVYAVANVTISSGTVTATGFLRARRPR